MQNPIGNVYLAGPITGLVYAEADDWRDHVAACLAPSKIQCFSPMRIREKRHADVVISALAESKHPLQTQRGITARDRSDVRRSDLVVVNLLGAKIPSLGTMIELGWANAFDKPIIMAMEEENVHRHLMVQELADVIVADLAGMIEAVCAFLTNRNLAV